MAFPMTYGEYEWGGSAPDTYEYTIGMGCFGGVGTAGTAPVDASVAVGALADLLVEQDNPIAPVAVGAVASMTIRLTFNALAVARYRR